MQATKQLPRLHLSSTYEAWQELDAINQLKSEAIYVKGSILFNVSCFYRPDFILIYKSTLGYLNLVITDETFWRWLPVELRQARATTDLMASKHHLRPFDQTHPALDALLSPWVCKPYEASSTLQEHANRIGCAFLALVLPKPSRSAKKVHVKHPIIQELYCLEYRLWQMETHSILLHLHSSHAVTYWILRADCLDCQTRLWWLKYQGNGPLSNWWWPSIDWCLSSPETNKAQ